MRPPINNGHITRLMSHLVRRHHHNIHTLLNEHHVYPGQPPLMFALAREGGQSQNELARQLDIKAATLTVMLNRMEKNGLVRRETDARDLRVSRIYLSDKGHSTLKIVRETLDMLEQRALDNFSEEETELLRGLLARMNDNVTTMSETLPLPNSANDTN
ncbi:hypothetical protein BK133_24660 [Paenibacillus sp. FSL H8-0548]|uniref:MarR family winged helix-turn-helix transcriptional regulator n=1 Tax=Paenibacillus sp. FSL H8-0548 TaxID=1920422 RepID=UPI00096EDD67|nr:MarR family transcriptional regulator [Paenibacillus sp. FSL H8-0548]OMF23243.1 hypothetical protein BK133_24660 [Paenibacillus sp. FSL H8-0548]